MANRIILLCLLLSYTILQCVEVNANPRRGGGGSRGGGSRGRSSSHTSSHWGSSHHSYPSSSSGLSGYGSSGSSNHGYPSSSSGLSGYGSSRNTYNPSYPSSNSGLSGYGSSGSSYHPSYPSSNSGLSGYGSSGGSIHPSYPSSNSGLSGYGSGTRSHYNPTYTHSSSGGYGSAYNKPSYENNYRSYNPGYHHFYTPTYYSGPHTVYVNEYRNSNSRYGDILTGLALYNMGRSHNNHYHHYYYDDYYRQRSSHSTYYSPDKKPVDEANCTLRIKEEGKLQVLSIPCEIVSTFTDGITTSTPRTTTTTTQAPIACRNVTTNTIESLSITVNDDLNTNDTLPLCVDVAQQSIANNGNVTKQTLDKANLTVINPVTQTGPPVDVKKLKECTIAIQTKTSYVEQDVDCNLLIKYAKMPKPKKSTFELNRSTLKSYLQSPPWWLSMFIAA